MATIIGASRSPRVRDRMIFTDGRRLLGARNLVRRFLGRDLIR